MTYDEHSLAAQEMSRDEVNAALKVLALGKEFRAVVRWLEFNREDWVNSSSHQVMASNHGTLAHGQGSVHAMNTLIAQLANLLNPKATQGGIPKPEGV